MLDENILVTCVCVCVCDPDVTHLTILAYPNGVIASYTMMMMLSIPNAAC